MRYVSALCASRQEYMRHVTHGPSPVGGIAWKICARNNTILSPPASRCMGWYVGALIVHHATKYFLVSIPSAHAKRSDDRQPQDQPLAKTITGVYRRVRYPDKSMKCTDQCDETLKCAIKWVKQQLSRCNQLWGVVPSVTARDKHRIIHTRTVRVYFCSASCTLK